VPCSEQIRQQRNVSVNANDAGKQRLKVAAGSPKVPVDKSQGCNNTQHLVLQFLTMPRYGRNPAQREKYAAPSSASG